MSTLWKRAVATTAIAVVAGLGITACSPAGDGGSQSAKGPTAQQEQAQPKVAATKPMTAGDFGKRVNDAMSAAKSAHAVVTVSAQGKDVNSVGDMMLDADPKKMRMHMNMSVAAQTLEIILVDGTIYMNMGATTQGKYVKISADDGNPVAAQMESMLAQSDAAKQMQNVSAAMTGFTVAGAEKVDGVDTTHYVLTLDTAKLLAAQGADATQATGIGDTITYDVYADGKDLIRRAVMDMGSVKTTIEYSKWGEAVAIEAPAADQLIEMPGI